MHAEDYGHGSVYILPAEHVGTANVIDGVLDIGGVKVPFPNRADVYVRRASNDLSVMEIHICRHDGLAQEALDQQNEEAEHHPLGAKEYWRSKMVGKYTFGPDDHPLTNAEFEAEWAEGNE